MQDLRDWIADREALSGHELVSSVFGTSMVPSEIDLLTKSADASVPDDWEATCSSPWPPWPAAQIIMRAVAELDTESFETLLGYYPDQLNRMVSLCLSLCCAQRPMLMTKMQVDRLLRLPWQPSYAYHSFESAIQKALFQHAKILDQSSLAEELKSSHRYPVIYFVGEDVTGISALAPRRLLISGRCISPPSVLRVNLNDLRQCRDLEELHLLDVRDLDSYTLKRLQDLPNLSFVRVRGEDPRCRGSALEQALVELSEDVPFELVVNFTLGH